MMTQIATQIAPTRYLVGRGGRGESGRPLRIGLGCVEPVDVDAGSTRRHHIHWDAGHAWLRLVRIICVTVKIRMMKARISDSAAP